MRTNLKCICCKNKLLNWPTQKYCTSCSLFNKNLLRKLSYYKRKSDLITKKFYGTKNGAERIRK